MFAFAHLRCGGGGGGGWRSTATVDGRFNLMRRQWSWAPCSNAAGGEV